MGARQLPNKHEEDVVPWREVPGHADNNCTYKYL